MEKPPQFIKKFSNEESPEERQQATQDIKDKRSEHFTEKSTQTERQKELEQDTSWREQILVEKLEAIANLESKITELTSSRLRKILNNFQLNKLRADVAIGQRTYEELKEQQDIEITEEKEISEKLELEEIPPALQEAKEMLSNFYKGQREKWEETEYTKEDITENFSEEYLSSLSLEDYALLLKRFPGEMVAHVTRQGIRDHVGHMDHTAGQGAYADSFMKMVEDGCLRSPLGVYFVEGEKEQAIAKFLGLDDFKDKDEALDYLATLTATKQGASGSYADKMAVHFATEEVADSYYGSEQGNEIFVVYPSAHIASQYYFSGQLNESGGGYWNDQWVWANEEKGMNLNAGLIFIPEEAMVDRKTGSRYELDEDRHPIKNSEYQSVFRKVIDSADFQNLADQVIEITSKLSASMEWKDPNLLPKDQEILKKLEPFREKLEQEFNITDQRLQFAILDYHNLSMIKQSKKGSPHSVEEIIEDAMSDQGILYTEAKDAITSKEFWETHFAKNPDKKPSKIIYYKGANPTEALRQWRKERGIDKKTEDKNLGFSERNIERSAPQATVGIDRFKTLAEKIIEDYFKKTEPSY